MGRSRFRSQPFRCQRLEQSRPVDWVDQTDITLEVSSLAQRIERRLDQGAADTRHGRAGSRQRNQNLILHTPGIACSGALSRRQPKAREQSCPWRGAILPWRMIGEWRGLRRGTRAALWCQRSEAHAKSCVGQESVGDGVLDGDAVAQVHPEDHHAELNLRHSAWFDVWSSQAIVSFPHLTDAETWAQVQYLGELPLPAEVGANGAHVVHRAAVGPHAVPVGSERARVAKADDIARGDQIGSSAELKRVRVVVDMPAIDAGADKPASAIATLSARAVWPHREQASKSRRKWKLGRMMRGTYQAEDRLPENDHP